jgi:hypothetical protein
MSGGGTISVATSGTGNAGDIALNVNNFTQTGGASVDSSTSSGGTGGDLTVTAINSATISDAGSGLFSTASGTGAGGGITLRGSNIQLLNGGVISANSTGTATANAGDIKVIFGDTLGMVNGSITTAANLADGGNISITGTNGKTTTTELVERVLTRHHLKTIAAGNIGLPLCRVVKQTRELDFITLEVSSFQLETTRFFRPAIGVLLNLTPDHLDRYPAMADYMRAKARLFANQQAFDWAIVQSEALAQLRTLNVEIPSKIITFSAANRRADGRKCARRLCDAASRVKNAC